MYKVPFLPLIIMLICNTGAIAQSADSQDSGNYVLKLMSLAINGDGPSEKANLEPSLYAAYAKIKCLERPGLGAELTQSQDPGNVSSLSLKTKSDDGKSGTVRVQFTSEGNSADVTVQVIKKGNAWKVSEICAA